MVASVPWRAKECVNTCFEDLTSSREDADLWEAALLINEGQQIQRFDGQHVQDLLVVLIVDACPHDVFSSVLFLLQPEHVLDEELLQLLVGKVDAELFEAVTNPERRDELEPTTVFRCHCLLATKWNRKKKKRTCFCQNSQSQRCQASLLSAGGRQTSHARCKLLCWFCQQHRWKVVHRLPAS